MIQVGGRRAQQALLFVLCLGGKRTFSTAFRFPPLLPRRPTAAHVSPALSSTGTQAVAEPAQGLETALGTAGSSRQLSKAVVVARGKARLFW